MTAIHMTDGALLSPTQAAKVLGLSSDSVRRLSRTGKLAAIETPIGRVYDAEVIARFARERASGADLSPAA